MDDLPEKDTPRAWIAAGIMLAAIGLAFVMLVYTTIRANAQELCAPASEVFPVWDEIHHERPVWEGVTNTPNGPVETVLLQSATGTWSMFLIRNGIACLTGAGQDGTPIETGKGV